MDWGHLSERIFIDEIVSKHLSMSFMNGILMFNDPSIDNFFAP